MKVKRKIETRCGKILLYETAKIEKLTVQYRGVNLLLKAGETKAEILKNLDDPLITENNNFATT
jgi:hypothetical protein